MLRRLLTCAVIALLVAVPRFVWSHSAPFSYLDLKIGAAGIDGTLVVHDFDVAHDLGIADPTQLARRRGRAATSRRADAADGVAAGDRRRRDAPAGRVAHPGDAPGAPEPATHLSDCRCAARRDSRRRRAVPLRPGAPDVRQRLRGRARSGNRPSSAAIARRSTTTPARRRAPGRSFAPSCRRGSSTS